MVKDSSNKKNKIHQQKPTPSEEKKSNDSIKKALIKSKKCFGSTQSGENKIPQKIKKKKMFDDDSDSDSEHNQKKKNYDVEYKNLLKKDFDIKKNIIVDENPEPFNESCFFLKKESGKNGYDCILEENSYKIIFKNEKKEVGTAQEGSSTPKKKIEFIYPLKRRIYILNSRKNSIIKNLYEISIITGSEAFLIFFNKHQNNTINVYTTKKFKRFIFDHKRDIISCIPSNTDEILLNLNVYKRNVNKLEGDKNFHADGFNAENNNKK